MLEIRMIKMAESEMRENTIYSPSRLEAAAPRVLYLAHGLQLVVDRLYHGAFAEQHLVLQLDQGVLHVAFYPGDEVYAVDE